MLDRRSEGGGGQLWWWPGRVRMAVVEEYVNLKSSLRLRDPGQGRGGCGRRRPVEHSRAVRDELAGSGRAYRRGEQVRSLQVSLPSIDHIFRRVMAAAALYEIHGWYLQ